VTRVLSGAVLIVFTIAVVWFASPPVFEVVAVLLLVVASRELVDLARASGLDVPLFVSTIAASATLGIAQWTAASYAPGPPWSFALVLVMSFLALAFVTLGSWRGGPNALATVAVSMLPSIYLALPIAALVGIRRYGGPQGLFLLMLTVIVSDSAQYYTGRAFGRTLLAPAISPKKTVEGATGGFVFGPLTLAIAGMWWLPNVPIAVRVMIGVAVVAMGIAGDLFESMLKRSAGVKDSSAMIPGHGGILDRIDALLFAAPVYYLLLLYV
jgi:phosphatidate cytidylyltransferase